MKLDIKTMAITAGLFWGIGGMLLPGLANLIWPGYGQAYLEVMDSVYPGYQATASAGQVIIGTLYGTVDGLVGGAIFAWLYNACAARAGGPGAT